MPIRAIYLFLFFSAVTLLIQIYTDSKKLKIDERRNYLMQGIVIALILNNHYDMLLYFIIFVTILLINSKINIGAGDKQILQWLTPGFMLLGHIFFSILFYTLFCITWFFYYIALTKLGKTQGMGTPIITTAWGLTILFYLLGANIWISFFSWKGV